MTTLTAVEPIRWTGRALEVLDQRLLPARERWLTCRTPAAVAKAISSMALRGAPLIGCAAAFGMALSKGGRRRLEKDAAVLKASRPTAVALAWAVDRCLKAPDIEAEARRIFSEDQATGRRMGTLGAALLKPGATAMTYCNTGALATAGIGTAFAVLRQGWRDGKLRRVYACETRPYLQGSRLTMWELQREGIPSVLITDNMAAALMARERIDAVFVGADRIAVNGDTANKIGTYALAIAARHHAVPFYVVAPDSTIDRALADGKRIPIEERSADEVTRIGSRRIAPKGVAARHPAFDVTPHALITAIITERGVFKAPYRFP